MARALDETQCMSWNGFGSMSDDIIYTSVHMTIWFHIEGDVVSVYARPGYDGSSDQDVFKARAQDEVACFRDPNSVRYGIGDNQAAGKPHAEHFGGKWAVPASGWWVKPTPRMAYLNPPLVATIVNAAVRERAATGAGSTKAWTEAQTYALLAAMGAAPMARARIPRDSNWDNADTYKTPRPRA